MTIATDGVNVVVLDPSTAAAVMVVLRVFVAALLLAVAAFAWSRGTKGAQ